MSKIVVAVVLDETEVLPGNAVLVANVEKNHVPNVKLSRKDCDVCACPVYKANLALGNANSKTSCEHLNVLKALQYADCGIAVDNKLYYVTSDCTLSLSVLLPRLQAGGTLPPGVYEYSDGAAPAKNGARTQTLTSYGLTLLNAVEQSRSLGSCETLVDGEVDPVKEQELYAYAEDLFKSKVAPEKQKKPAGTPLQDALSKYTFPKDDVFYITDTLKRQLVFALTRCKNLLLCGPSGSGKTEVIKEFAKAAGRTVVAFNLGAMTEARTSLIGSMTLTEKGTEFIRSKFIKAISTPNTIVLLDELTRAPMDAFNILLPVLDGQKTISIDEEGGAEVHVADGVVFAATANVGMEYTGTGVLDRALKDRFMIEHVSFPAQDFEAAILVKRCGCTPKIAASIVKLANEQRQRAEKEEEFSLKVSTRMLILTAEQIVFGITPHEAISHCIESFFSEEGGTESERTKMNQLSRKFFPITSK